MPRQVTQYATDTVVPRFTNVPTYDQFELRPALATKFCFNLQVELRVTIRKKGKEKGGKFKLLTIDGEEASSL